MSRFVFILLFVSTLFADVEINDWLVPIRIHYQDGKNEVAWTGYNNYQTFKLESEMPVSGRNILFVNKIGSDSLWVSDSLYRMADNFYLLFYERVVLLKKVAMVEIIHSDSLYPIGIFSDQILRNKQAKLAKTKKPLEYGLLVEEEDIAYIAHHIYIYNRNWTVERVKKLLKTEDGKKEIEKAEARGHIIVVEEVSP